VGLLDSQVVIRIIRCMSALVDCWGPSVWASRIDDSLIRRDFVTGHTTRVSSYPRLRFPPEHSRLRLDLNVGRHL